MKLIVADDEKWVRKTIVSTIPFEQLGLSLACEATNGIEAFELCQQHKPDILITDIKMPGLNGLELIEKLHSALPQIKIIIISGYSDFEYAKTAMNFGVTDYILKPVDENELTNVLSKIKTSILSERKQSEEFEYIKKQYKETSHIIFERFLNQLILPNTFTVDYIKANLSKYDIHFNLPYFTVCILHPENKSIVKNSSVMNYCKVLAVRVMKRYLGGVVFLNTSKTFELVVLINHAQNTLFSQIPKALDLYNKICYKRFKLGFFMGSSSSVQQIVRLPDLYNEALEALKMCFWPTPEKLFFYDAKSLPYSLEINLPTEIQDQLVLSIKLFDCPLASSYLDHILGWFSQHKNIKPDYIKEYLWKLTQSVISRLGQNIPMEKFEFKTANSSTYEHIKDTKSLEDLGCLIKELIQQLCDYCQRNTPIDQTNPVETAKKFIEQNCHENINLEQISKYVYLHPTYFSELFKKEIGMSFIDYKTMLRIEKAKDLLLKTNLNIDKISEKVGYTDPKYFSKLFKKITGMTLIDFKKNQKG
ncbi:MAG: response regulator [Clostridia bacterium]|nr:response regulator [Clostridia bacterium]